MDGCASNSSGWKNLMSCASPPYRKEGRRRTRRKDRRADDRGRQGTDKETMRGAVARHALARTGQCRVTAKRAHPLRGTLPENLGAGPTAQQLHSSLPLPRSCIAPGWHRTAVPHQNKRTKCSLRTSFSTEPKGAGPQNHPIPANPIFKKCPAFPQTRDHTNRQRTLL